jgi:ubiquinone/menaquinone biosynthesis C-methylase UbiE
MSDIPEQFTSEYYDQAYFQTPKGKKFKRPNGTFDAWSYANPDGESLGCVSIVEAWKKMFSPQTLLDIGAGRGTVVTYARDQGIEAEGFDFSEWAVNEGRYPRCKAEWLKVHDCTKPWPYPSQSFELVTALDLCEHIYVDDIPFLVKEMFRVAKKWVFLEIATVGGGSGSGLHEDGYILRKGDPIPIEREGNAVAGHVTVQTPQFWEEQFEHENWMLRRDMVNWFISLVPAHIIKNWLLNTVMILEKIG